MTRASETRIRSRTLLGFINPAQKRGRGYTRSASSTRVRKRRGPRVDMVRGRRKIGALCMRGMLLAGWKPPTMTSRMASAVRSALRNFTTLNPNKHGNK